MRRRALAVCAAVWTAAFAALYWVLIAVQQGEAGPAWWFLVSLAAAVALLARAALRPPATAALAVAAVLLGGCVVLGLLTVGILLVPAVLAVVLALASPSTSGPAARTLGRGEGAGRL